VAKPKVLFLDEPTTGLDITSRTEMWSVIRELLRGGTTLLLTTQYLEEADQLTDRIVVIDNGREIAQGTADELKLQVGGERVELTVARDEQMPAAVEALESVAIGEITVDDDARRITAPVAGGASSLLEALRRADAAGIELLDVGLRRPTLDDVFLSLTGHAATVDNETATGQATQAAP
jgi:ABC-2 type transport system ATP-binding protein